MVYNYEYLEMQFLIKRTREKFLKDTLGLSEEEREKIHRRYEEDPKGEFRKEFQKELQRVGYLTDEKTIEEDIQLRPDKKMLFLGKALGTFAGPVDYTETATQKEIKEKIHPGTIGVCKSSDGGIELYQYDASNVPLNLYGGKTCEVAFRGIRKVPKEEQMECLKKQGYSEREIVHLLNAPVESLKKFGGVEEIRNNAKKEEWREEQRAKLDNLWETVHGASLWWRNSGDYTDMHNELKEMQKYMATKDNIEPDDPKLKGMQQKIASIAVRYIQSKDPGQMKPGSNADKRYKAAMDVVEKLGDKTQKEMVRKAQEPQVEAQKPQAEAQEPQVEAKEPQAEAQEPQAEAQAIDSDLENPMPDHLNTIGDVDWILWHLKDKKILDKNVTKTDLVMGVIQSADKDKEPCRKMLKELDDIEKKELTEDTKKLLQEKVGRWIEKNNEAKQKKKDSQNKKPSHLKVGMSKLDYFNQVLNDAGSQDMYWRVGASMIEVIKADKNNIFYIRKGKERPEYYKNIEKKIRTDSWLLRRENELFSYEPKVSPYEKDNKWMIMKEHFPRYATELLMKNDRDNRVSNVAEGQNNREKNMDKLNVLYCLAMDGPEEFVNKVYDNVIRPNISLNNCNHDRNGFELEQIKTILNENKDVLNKKLQEYCKARVETRKAEETRIPGAFKQENQNEQKKNAQGPVM